MTLKILAPAILALATADAAFAQTVVIGDSDARQCYDAVFTNTSAHDSAIRTCQTALESKKLSLKDMASTYVNLGILQSRAGDYKASLASYDAAETLRPDFADIHLNKAVSLIYTSQFQESVAASTRALDLGTTKRAKVLVNRAMAYDGLEQHKLAYQDLKNAVETNPDWPLAREAISNYKVVSKTS